MGYAKIQNLYQNQNILLFRECYALEKVHGTSAHVRWEDGHLAFFSGGAKHTDFIKVFDVEALQSAYEQHFVVEDAVVVHGEAYGGKMQGMRATYGETLRFVAFDVRINKVWLSVPDAADVAAKLGLEFVPYECTQATVEAIDVERDRPSVLAERRGMGTDKVREGVVLRPLIELTQGNGARIISKHKADAFRETRRPRVVLDPAKLVQLAEAEAIAEEWVTPMRLTHVLDALGAEIGVERTGDVVKGMIADVVIEAGAEIVDTPEARKVIGARAAQMFHARLKWALDKARNALP